MWDNYIAGNFMGYEMKKFYMCRMYYTPGWETGNARAI